MLEAKHISKTFGDRQVLVDVNLQVKQGDVVVILGPSGSGKTTFLRCLNHLEKADGGQLTISGKDYSLDKLSKKDILDIRKKTAFVFQHYNLFANKTAIENILEGLVIARKVPKREAQEIAEEALKKVLEVLKLCVRGPKTLDLLICYYVYEKVGAKRKTVMRYRSALPQDKIFGWDDVKPLGTSHYLLMHSMIYRTSLFRECGMKLPEHTFYVDNLVAFIPLPYVKTMYYLDVNFYRYFIGRADQSVNEKVMIGRIDQQIRVNKLMIDYLGEQKGLSKYLRKYMISYLTIIMTVSSVMMMRSGTEENLEKKNDLWRYLKQEDAADYFRIRHGIFGTVMSSKS